MRHADQVAVFVQVVSEGSFTAAAKRLDMPKSTVSRRVTQLEERLGVRLLQRTTRKLHLTDEGEAYYRRAAAAFSTLEVAERELQQARAEPRGLLRVSAPVDFNRRAGELVARFCRLYPEVSVRMDFSQRKVDLIGEGYDLAIRGGVLNDSSLVARLLMPSSFGLFASQGYLDAHGVPREVDDLSRHVCLPLGSREEGVWELTGPDGHATEIRVQGPAGGNDFAFAFGLAREGLGIALLPLNAADARLVRVLPAYAFEAGGLFVVFPSSVNLAPRVRAFVDFLVEEMPKDRRFEWG